MNVLLVDDFPVIVESLKNGVNWNSAGIVQVYTACSSREAKLLITNFPIDILLCDIEMPGENGLELVRWTKEEFPDIECIFLTSHAEFEYAQEALRIGCFDYILQPVKFEDVEAAMQRVCERVREKQKTSQMVSIADKAMSQEREILELMLAKLRENQESAANQICKDYKFMCGYFFSACAVYQMVVHVTRLKKDNNIRSIHTIKDLIEEDLLAILGSENARITAAEVEKARFLVMVFVDKNKITDAVWEEKIESFYEYVMKNRDYEVVLFPSLTESEDNYVELFRWLTAAGEESGERNKAIVKKRYNQNTWKIENSAIESALKFIDKNLNKNLSRSEIAKEVHLSEEYFSRLFKQTTGYTFKDYMMLVKMETAKELLTRTKLSVSIVASKVGYSNFSYFSHAFKSYTGYTPQEYRKQNINSDKTMEISQNEQ